MRVQPAQQMLRPAQLSGRAAGRRSVIAPAAAAQPQQEAVVVAIPNSKEEAVSMGRGGGGCILGGGDRHIGWVTDIAASLVVKLSQCADVWVGDA